MASPHLPAHAPQKQPASCRRRWGMPSTRTLSPRAAAATMRVRCQRCQRCQSVPDPETGLHHFQQVALSVALEPLQLGARDDTIARQQRHATFKRASSRLHAADAHTYTNQESPAAHQVPSMQQVAQLAAAKVHTHCGRTTAPEGPLTRLTRARWHIEKQLSIHAHCSTGQSRCQRGAHTQEAGAESCAQLRMPKRRALVLPPKQMDCEHTFMHAAHPTAALRWTGACAAQGSRAPAARGTRLRGAGHNGARPSVYA